MSKSNIARRGAPIATALLMALVLAACGGGGGNPGSTSSTAGSGSTGNTGNTGSTGTVTAAAPASVQFVAAAPADKSIVIKGQGGNGRTETATLTFKVVDMSGNALANQQVNFALVPAGSATLNTTTGKTGADGTVIATVSSGATPTTLRVQATVAGTGTGGKADLTTLSDTITVTTGVAVQNAFSISTDIFNVEGWNIDSSPTKPAAHIQVLLADAFGNPVADGTPVVFQTNAGSVGSADRGGCTTVNGGCSVDFRAQQPRVPTPGQPATPCNSGGGTDGNGAGVVADSTRKGVATICASSTNGTKTLFDSIALYLSGSFASHVYLDSAASELDFTPGYADLGSLGAGKSRTLWLQIDDINYNPMPAGTKIVVSNTQNVTAGAVAPSTVPNISPGGASGTSQGSWHQVTITAAQPANCSGAQDATFTVSVTTPGVSTTAGSAAGPTTTDIPFKLSVTCP
jgi:hypothetical protein